MHTVVETDSKEPPVPSPEIPRAVPAGTPLIAADVDAPAGPAAAPHRLGFFRQLGRDLGYSLASFFISIPAFSVVVTLFSAGVGTLVIYLGLFVLIGCLFCASFFAAAERNLAEWNRGPLPPHVYKQIVSRGQKGLLTPLSDSLRWREAIHAVLVFPIRIAVFCLALTWLLTGAGELTAFYWKRFLPEDNRDLWDLLGVNPVYHDWIDVGIGLFFIVTLPFVLKGSALLLRVFARSMLTNQSSVLKEQVRRAEASRDSAVAAEAGNLRRLERDIHDGPQQRLVRVSMDLKSAQRRLARGEAGASELVAEALKQTQDTLGELRAISRGIAPPILVDRGLPAAVEAAAARTPVPVTVRVEGLGKRRLAENIENTAYFVIAESLTNVAKHAHATCAEVTLRKEPGQLTVQIADDGQGGAHLGKGHGLVGLQERAVANGGSLELASDGSGTTVSLTLPLAG